MSFKTKIRMDQINWGPKECDRLAAVIFAKELREMGYIKTSNAYCSVSRVDREDWLDVLARERHCSRADFYNYDGSGVGHQHYEYYCRVYSKDTLTVHPEIIRCMSTIDF
jgi:hypothetical protein